MLGWNYSTMCHCKRNWNLKRKVSTAGMPGMSRSLVGKNWNDIGRREANVQCSAETNQLSSLTTLSLSRGVETYMLP